MGWLLVLTLLATCQSAVSPWEFDHWNGKTRGERYTLKEDHDKICKTVPDKWLPTTYIVTNIDRATKKVTLDQMLDFEASGIQHSKTFSEIVADPCYEVMICGSYCCIARDKAHARKRRAKRGCTIL